MNLKTLPAVARSFYTFCKKCDTDRYFTVLTHVSSITAKIKCEVCKCQSKFTLGVDAKEKTVPAKRGTAAKVSTTSSTWLKFKSSIDESAAKAYTVSATFKNEEAVNHPKFGLGFVTKVYPNKVEVLFAEGFKELLHSRA